LKAKYGKLKGFKFVVVEEEEEEEEEEASPVSKISQFAL
jgi:hypothetical protein